MTEVELPDGTVVEFPEGMTRAQIQEILRRKFPKPEAPNATTQRVQRNLADAQANREFVQVSPQVAEQEQRILDEATLAGTPRGFDVLAKFNQGIPFIGSWLDEAADFLRPGAGAAMRESQAAMDRQRPGLSTALEVGGGVAGTIPLLAAAVPTLSAGAVPSTLLGRVGMGGLLGGVTGATEGAIYGAGIQEGGRGANARQGAAVQGGLGAVLGAAAPYAVDGVSALLQRLRGSDARFIAQELGISAAAARVVKNALETGDMQAAEDALRRAGPDAMLADAGQPARELLDAAATRGGRAGAIATEAVEERAARSGRNVSNALDDAMGLPQSADEIASTVRRQTAGARSSAFDTAYSRPIDYSAPAGRQIESLMPRVPGSALRTANELMRTQGEQSAQILFDVADDGSVTLFRMPDVRQIDYITRALNEVADRADGQGKLGGTTALGKSYRDLARQLRGAAKEAVPEYATALEVAGDAISEVNAGRFGANLFTRRVTAREAIAELANMSGFERRAAQTAARDYIDNVMANTRRAVSDPNMDAREAITALRQLSSRDARQKMGALLGSQEAERLAAQLDEAAAALELRASVGGNSRTAIRQAIQGTVDDQTALGPLGRLLAGEPVEATKTVVQALTGKTAEAQALRQQGIYEEIASALVGKRGRTAQEALRVIRRAMDGQSVTEAEAQLVARAVVGGGVLTGSREGQRLLTTP